MGDKCDDDNLAVKSTSTTTCFTRTCDNEIFMLRQHMLIMHVDRVEIMKNADLVHALCARETSYAYMRLYTWSGQLVLLFICVGPPVAAVSARCEGAAKLTWGYWKSRDFL